MFLTRAAATGKARSTIVECEVLRTTNDVVDTDVSRCHIMHVEVHRLKGNESLFKTTM